MYRQHIEEAWIKIRHNTAQQIRMLQGQLYKGERIDQPYEYFLEDLFYKEFSRLKSSGENSEQSWIAGLKKEYDEKGRTVAAQLVDRVTQHYLEEITGNFNQTTYNLISKIFPRLLPALLSYQNPRNILSQAFKQPQIDKYFLSSGETELLKKLSKRGTIILVPTHSSNMDSILIGFALHLLGLPPFLYGAGLNLFSNPVFGFFMHRLGAYKVDRRKKNEFYNLILKEYCSYSLELGYHNLFFPSGGRARSGGIESKLKVGLLGCGIQAYTHNLKNKKANPNVYIFPCTLNYHLVLEANTLIEDFLQETGKRRYIISDDESSRWEKVTQFFHSLVTLNSKIHLKISAPLDPFGNNVNSEGQSVDHKGRPIDTSKYLENIAGEIVSDRERDFQYTLLLSERVISRFKQDSIALTTHVVAYVLFDLVRAQNPHLDLFQLAKTEIGNFAVHSKQVYESVEKLLGQIAELHALRKIDAEEIIRKKDVVEVVKQGLGYLQTFHEPVAVVTKGDMFLIQNFKVIYYYRNRLGIYDFRCT